MSSNAPIIGHAAPLGSIAGSPRQRNVKPWPGKHEGQDRHQGDDGDDEGLTHRASPVLPHHPRRHRYRGPR
jgi:hypothetical protein